MEIHGECGEVLGQVVHQDRPQSRLDPLLVQKLSLTIVEEIARFGREEELLYRVPFEQFQHMTR
ncbi:hypothetical protein [Paenibacillus sp. Soil766]|uniref:hypothetical protein n=1 Tax=Paenibacillus sp. Soil766 TaxID=1736404 RepID=UPI001F2B790A|nr:hypothetical protein [Paenibacillus sp. Soil766]